MRRSKIMAALSAAVMAAGIMTALVSAEVNPFTNEYFRLQTQDKHGFAFVDGVLTKTDESGTCGFTGRVKVNGDMKFYDNGVQWIGWRKIGGKWYYFDPDNNGIMAEGKVKTALGTYYLDENGAWNGKLSRSALCPEDFSFEVSDWAYGYGFEIGTFDNTLMESHFVDGADVIRDINISKRDLQIFYDTVINCNLTAIDEELYGAKLSEKSTQKITDESGDMIIDGEPTDINYYTVKLLLNGETYTVKGNWTMYMHYDEFETVRELAYFLAFTKGYAQGLPQYAEITAAEDAAVAAIIAAENN